MKYNEEKRDLFSLSLDDYIFVQCISADFKMGKGIATEFNKRYNTKNNLIKKYNNRLGCVNNRLFMSCVTVDDKIFNLITKERYYEKPTYQTLYNSLIDLKDYLILFKIKKKIAMPKIGCGLDRLQWNEVSKIIKKIFKDTDFEILICYKE